MLTRDFKFRVWYKDTDQMGIVHHSNYICYYEAARSELLRSFGSSYADMEEKDGVMIAGFSKYTPSTCVRLITTN